MTDQEGGAPQETIFSRPLGEPALRAARRGLDIAESATAQERAALAEAFGVLEIPSLAFTARLTPEGEGWRLKGRLRAEAAQACVVTLEPVAETIDEPFERLWSPDAVASDAGEVAAGRLDAIEAEAGALGEDSFGPEALGAVEAEPVPDPIDPAAAAVETFALALDPYPRAAEAQFEGFRHGPPGAAPLTEEALKPFSGLAALREGLAQDSAPPEDARQEDAPPEDGAEDDAPQEDSATQSPAEKDGRGDAAEGILEERPRRP